MRKRKKNNNNNILNDLLPGINLLSILVRTAAAAVTEHANDSNQKRKYILVKFVFILFYFLSRSLCWLIIFLNENEVSNFDVWCFWSFDFSLGQFIIHVRRTKCLEEEKKNKQSFVELSTNTRCYLIIWPLACDLWDLNRRR